MSQNKLTETSSPRISSNQGMKTLDRSKSLRVKALRDKFILSKPINTQSYKSLPTVATPEENLRENRTSTTVTESATVADYIATPPRPIEDDTAGSVAFMQTSIGSMDTGRRKSLLINSGKRIGVEMDMATREANEMLLKGKQILENPGIIKKEAKTTVQECLQSLYEIVLALSDSRSRHKSNLEKERLRCATELMKIEKTYQQQIAELHNELVVELRKDREVIHETNKTTNIVRDWLSYETREPYGQIANIEKTMKTIETRVMALESNKNVPSKCSEIEYLQKDYDIIKTGVDKLSQQLDEMRRANTKTLDNTTVISTNTRETLNHLKAQTESSHDIEKNTKITEQLANINSVVSEIKTNQISISAQKREPFPPLPNIVTKEHLQPITEKLDVVSSEIKMIMQEKSPLAAVNVTLDKEIEAAVGKRPSTYAKVAAKPLPPPKPNHTLIISSTDPKSTGDKVIEKLRQALDTKSTGAKVDQVRKGRNQKVIVRCGTKEDLDLVNTRIRLDKHLRAEVAKAGNPLIIVRDVLSYHKDTEIVENIISQNKHLLNGIDMKESTLKVKYRKRARNPHECHPILELSPKIYQRFLEAGKIYIGLQRRPVADHSPLVQCTRCLGFGHTKVVCREKDELCSYCGEAHSWENCKKRAERKAPTCINCAESKAKGISLEHNAFSVECSERARWDAIARSKIAYC